MVAEIMADLCATCKNSLEVGFGVCMGVGFCVCGKKMSRFLDMLPFLVSRTIVSQETIDICQKYS